MRGVKAKLSLSSKEFTGFIGKSNRSMFDTSFEEQKEFLKKLGPGKDDYDRSYKQYLCHCFFQNNRFVIVMNIVSYIALPFFLLFVFLKGLFIKKRPGLCNAIATKGADSRMPDELLERFNYIYDNIGFSKLSLKLKDVLFCLGIFIKYPLHPFFVFKISFKVAYYSYLFHVYSPKAMLVMNEYSYTSSLLTLFCQRRGVLHIDIMHGEKFFYIHDSYFRYHECWIWNEHYKHLFMAMNAYYDQFHISVPKMLRIDCNLYKDDNLYSDFKYYLQIFSEKQIKDVAEVMKNLKNKGATIKLRPHPIWSDVELLKKYVDKEDIENPKEVSILQSVSNLKYAIGSFSTVLNQAYYSGKMVVLDDVAFKDQYEKLKMLWYPLIEMESYKLSKITSEVSEF